MKMREIKFRAWNNETKKMETDFYPLFEYENGKATAIGFRDEKDNEQLLTDGSVIMQYTGLKDKIGKEIYEGDILKDSYYNRNLEIFWNSLGCGGWWFSEEIGGCKEHVERVDLKYFEVIGNIYENPELLSEGV